MKTMRLLASVQGMLVAIAVIGVVLAFIRFAAPVSRETAIRIARQHALETYPGIKLDEYAISAPTRSDWFEEWGVYFHHKSRNAGFLILIAGGDLYNDGGALRVNIDNEWGSLP
jgi:hypothetical protein